MKKPSIAMALLGIIIWGGVTVGCTWVVWKILVIDADPEVDTRTPQQWIRIAGGLLLLFVILVQLWKCFKERKRYENFEKRFPELKNGIADLSEDNTSFYQPLDHLALYKGVFIGNWEFDFIDLSEVASVYYDRSAGVRRRTGALVGDKPQLVFRKKNGEEQKIRLHNKSGLPALFESMSKEFSEIRFGKEELSWIAYLPILESKR